MKSFFKKGFKLTAITMAAAITAAALSGCSFGKKSVPASTTTPTAASQDIATETPNPEKLIVGKWEVINVTDQNGEEVNLADADLSGTPLESYASVIGMVLKKGVSIEFKEDKTIPLVITTGEYEIDGDNLIISIPKVSSQSIKTTFDINESDLTIKIGTYTINLTKK